VVRSPGSAVGRAGTGNLKYPRISPDQKTVAFVRTEKTEQIWLLDLIKNRIGPILPMIAD
jgi:hypothetical protein